VIALSRWVAAGHGVPRLAWGVLVRGKLVWALLMLALLVLGTEVMSLFARPVASATGATQDFPPLMMVWRDIPTNGSNGTPGPVQTFRLDYADRCHQRLTLLENSAWPNVPVFYTQFDGRTRITHTPGQGPDVIATIEPNDCWPPDRYLLVPIAFDNPRELAKRPGWVQQPAEHGLMLVSYDDTVPVAGGVVPEHIEITYRPDDGLPLHVIDVVNGREAHRRDVIELSLGT
jgi:hypothetical protein